MSTINAQHDKLAIESDAFATAGEDQEHVCPCTLLDCSQHPFVAGSLKAAFDKFGHMGSMTACLCLQGVIVAGQISMLHVQVSEICVTHVCNLALACIMLAFGRSGSYLSFQLANLQAAVRKFAIQHVHMLLERPAYSIMEMCSFLATEHRAKTKI